MLDSNSQDNADGARATLRSRNNPSSSSGSIFSVRSSGQSARLWVGQYITTSGDNNCYAGFDGSNGSKGVPSNYKHNLMRTISKSGTPVQCDYDLSVAGTLTTASLYGGAATQITSQINTAVSGKQSTLTAHGGGGNNVINSQLPADTIVNIFGRAPINVSGMFDPGTSDHGNLQISCNVIWDAGQLTDQATGTNNADHTVGSSRRMTTHPVTFSTAFTYPPLVFASMAGKNAGHATIDRVWVQDNITTTGCNIVVSERTGSTGVALAYFAIQARSRQTLCSEIVAQRRTII